MCACVLCEGHMVIYKADLEVKEFKRWRRNIELGVKAKTCVRQCVK